MKTARCLLTTGLATVIGLLYVFQQTEVVKLGYQITAQEKELEVAQDRRTALEYTLSTLESPVSIEQNFMLPNGSFEMPRTFRLVKIEEPASTSAAALSVAASSTSSGWRRFAFHSLFSARQAEARPVKEPLR
jgi:hypothetical protein